MSVTKYIIGSGSHDSGKQSSVAIIVEKFSQSRDLCRLPDLRSVAAVTSGDAAGRIWRACRLAKGAWISRGDIGRLPQGKPAATS